jgi:hypothetical protein
MKAKGQNRTTTGELEQRLLRYSGRAEGELAREERRPSARWLGFSGAAAAAATLAPAAHAAVIYSGPRNVELVRTQLSFITSAPIDLDGDGGDDIEFLFSYTYSSGRCRFTGDCVEARGLDSLDLMATVVKVLPYGRELLGIPVVRAGETIGSSRLFTNSFDYDNLLRSFRHFRYYTPGDPPSFVGIRMANGEYGWIRVNIDYGTIDSSVQEVVFRVVDWAYESEAGQSIQAGQIPEPGTGALTGLGLLALGAVGVRRERARRARRECDAPRG